MQLQIYTQVLFPVIYNYIQIGYAFILVLSTYIYCSAVPAALMDLYASIENFGNIFNKMWFRLSPSATHIAI